MEWRPIDTLPKDIEIFIGFVPKYYKNRRSGDIDEICICERDSGYAFGFRDRHGKFNDGDIFPTHWMPLPKAPVDMG